MADVLQIGEPLEPTGPSSSGAPDLSLSVSVSQISSSLSGAISSTSSLSSAVSTVDSGQNASLSSGAISSTTSLSSAVSTVDSTQSTSLSQISSSLSGAISSTTSLSSALGTAATKNIGTSGATVPLLNGAAVTWTAGATFGGAITVNGSFGSSFFADLGSNPGFRIAPNVGVTFSNFQLQGEGGNINAGLDILAGGGAAYFSVDTHVHRDHTQLVNFTTTNNSGFNINTGVLQIAGTQLLTTRQTKPATPTLTDVINLLVTHGLWA